MLRFLSRLLGKAPNEPPPAPPNPRDISEDDLSFMRGVVQYPEMLDELVASGRKNLGFFPAHNVRTHEYPWVLANIRKDPSIFTVLDVGAGLNPLPFVLSNDGLSVTTIDGHPGVRLLEPKHTWNEWGFLDYSSFDPKISSFQTPYEEFKAPHVFDCAYSVSVIEHVPAAVRKKWVKRFADDLKENGLLLLTLDLVPDTDDLWNLAADLQVEDPAEHGTSWDLCKELEEGGFKVESNETVRKVRGSHIDTGFVIARK